MRYRVALLAMILLVFGGSALVQQRIDEPLRPEVTTGWQCQRIVSMAPSITETLFALGLGDRVVGVSRDSNHPPEVEEIKKSGNVGGYLDPNFEAVIALRPDLVILLEEQAQSLPGIAKLDFETLVVSHKTVDGIIESFRTIGRVCGRGPEGRQMEQSFRDRLNAINVRTRDLPRPRVLIVLDRLFGSGHLADVYVAGVDDYFDKMIELSGGQNAYRQRGVRYPVVSTEGILRLNPDVIVELAPPDKLRQLGRQALLDDWKDVDSASAVKNNRIMIFADDYATIPGPRFIRLVEQLARTLHPNIDLEDRPTS
ncbi:MAG: helical backbone metal receptor [Thermoguttaceae bacterium]